MYMLFVIDPVLLFCCYYFSFSWIIRKRDISTVHDNPYGKSMCYFGFYLRGNFYSPATCFWHAINLFLQLATCHATYFRFYLYLRTIFYFRYERVYVNWNISIECSYTCQMKKNIFSMSFNNNNCPVNSWFSLDVCLFYVLSLMRYY